MLLRHHEDTRNLETRQQRAVHALRGDQVTRQHETELQHQHDYSERAHNDLRKRHASQLRQQPKSLKVSVIYILFLKKLINIILLNKFT